MTKQNKTKLQFVTAAILLMTFAVAGCNGSGDNKEDAKDTTKVVTAAPVVVKDSNDTMEAKKGNVAPGSDIKP